MRRVEPNGALSPLTAVVDSVDGEPIHYPTEAEIAQLSRKEPDHSARTAKRFLLFFVLFVAALWCLALMSDEPATKLDPLRAHLHERRMHLW